MTLIPLDCKQLILEDAKERILKNHTLEQIAKTHGITKRTLNTWLMSLGEEYQELRQLCIDNMLAEALEEIDNA
jgi:transposase-like protein